MIANLKKLRERAGVSQKHLADAVSVSQQSINKYENHGVEPDIATLIRLADYFDTSVDYLIGHSEIDHRSEPVQSCDLNADELALVTDYRILGAARKRSVRMVIESYNEKA